MTKLKFSSQTWKVTAWKPVCIVLWRWLATWSAPSVEPMLVHTPSLSPRLCTATIVSKSPWLSLLPGMRRCSYRQSTDNVSWHWMFPSLLSALVLPSIKYYYYDQVSTWAQSRRNSGGPTLPSQQVFVKCQNFSPIFAILGQCPAGSSDGDCCTTTQCTKWWDMIME